MPLVLKIKTAISPAPEFCKCGTESAPDAKQVCAKCALPMNPNEMKESDEPKYLRTVRRSAWAAPTVIVTVPGGVSAKAYAELLGQAVFFGSGPTRVAGKVARAEGDKLILKLAVPNRDGLLCVTDSEVTVKAGDLEITPALMQDRRVAPFEFGAAFHYGQKFVAVEDPDCKGVVSDYQNVTIEGHASTFSTPDRLDRGGDYVMKTAWNRTLTEFKRNPVMLIDHDNEVKSIAGSWTKVQVDGDGLGVQGMVSNSPGMRDLRFKIIEGHLKGLSIGGIWYYANDGKGIEDADLYEVSLVAVPMNADTLFHARKLTEADCRKSFAKFWRTGTALRPANFRPDPPNPWN